MKTKSYKKENLDTIDFQDLVVRLWKEKLLILLLSFIGGFLAYQYTLTLPESDFKSEIILKEPSSHIFLNIEEEIGHKSSTNEKENYLNNLKFIYQSKFLLNIKSNDLQATFITENKNQAKNKKILNEKKIIINEFTRNRIVEDKKYENGFSKKYYFTFPSWMDGQSYLNDFVNYAKKKTIEEFLNDLRRTIKKQIRIHEQSLLIANEIGLTNPIMQNLYAGGNMLVSEPHDLYYKGTTVLKQKIKNLQSFYKKLNYNTIDYNVILDSATAPASAPRVKMKTNVLLGFIIGFISSLILILLRNILNKR